ncbi:MAG: CoA-binding protein [Deltaproteobacteria bacterium]|jgi:predicted CoA-binding protein|nr:CoA-binding protein [Deltaproteobacteria bacterium]
MIILSAEKLASIRRILNESKTIAVVGLSPKPNRPSHRVATYLMEAGYTVIPVNPGQDNILGRTCYPNLKAVPVQVDMVDIFHRSETVLPIVEDAIAIGAKYIWMQEGIVNEDAAAKAEAAGLEVIMDRCTKTDHMNLL